MHSPLIGYEGAGGVPGVPPISSEVPGGLGPCVLGHQVINIFSLLKREGLFFISAKLKKCASKAII